MWTLLRLFIFDTRQGLDGRIRKSRTSFCSFVIQSPRFGLDSLGVIALPSSTGTTYVNTSANTDLGGVKVSNSIVLLKDEILHDPFPD